MAKIPRGQEEGKKWKRRTGQVVSVCRGGEIRLQLGVES